jgi:hypothetical protein
MVMTIEYTVCIPCGVGQSVTERCGGKLLGNAVKRERGGKRVTCSLQL